MQVERALSHHSSRVAYEMVSGIASPFAACGGPCVSCPSTATGKEGEATAPKTHTAQGRPPPHPLAMPLEMVTATEGKINTTAALINVWQEGASRDVPQSV